MSSVQLSFEQHGRLRRLIYDQLGLSFDNQKLYFLSKRVAARMECLNLDDPADYLKRLAHNDGAGTEMQALANLITTNETYMFREYEQLEAFANACLPEVIARKEAVENRSLRIWSAGCSSGEEVYTLAMIVQEVFPAIADWDTQIVATDIDQQRLAMAIAGVYGERSMKYVPPEYLARHFTRQGEDWKVAQRTRAMVTIQSLNLNDRPQMRKMRAFDFIFCRNVLIYFDDASRKAAVDHFYGSLNPGGFLFLGHSESVGRISSAFRLRRMGEQLVYMKPGASL